MIESDLQRGSYDLIQRSGLFDEEWYLKAYSEVTRGECSPVEHFLTEGWRKGYSPSMGFNTEFYLLTHEDVAESGECPLVHYVREGKEMGRGISSDVTDYKKWKRRKFFSRFLTFWMPKGMRNRWRQRMCDERFFQKDSFAHSTLARRYRRIDKSGYFDKKWYAKKYLKENVSRMDPLLHYLIVGWEKGFAPSAKFNPTLYYANNPDLAEAGVQPLEHYLDYGRKEGRGFPSEESERRFVLWNFFKRYFYRLWYCRKISRNKNKKILVHLHLYYVSQWKTIASYLKNLAPYDYDLVVTYTDQEWADRGEDEDIRIFKKGAELVFVENRGFDLAPFIKVISERDLGRYDVVFKIHTKRSIHGKVYYEQLYMEGTQWRQYLYDGVLGERTVHEVIDTLIHSDKYGQAAHHKMVANHDLTENMSYTLNLMDEYGIKVPQHYQFIMGTMFAMKASLLEEIKRKIRYEDFEESKRDYFTKAHAVERILSLHVLSAQYEFMRVKTYSWLDLVNGVQNLGKSKGAQEGYIYPSSVEIPEFYKIQSTTASRLFVLSSVMRRVVPGLFSELLNFAEDEEVLLTESKLAGDSATAGKFLARFLVDREVGRFYSNAETTVFRLLGNHITIQKTPKKRVEYSFLQVCPMEETFLSKGTYLMHLLKDALKGDSPMDEVVLILLPYIRRAYAYFQSSGKKNFLRPDSWDAIPRNTLIEEDGSYVFFDLNVKLIFGVRKEYFLYRVVRDLLIKLPELMGEKFAEDGYDLYEKLYGELSFAGNCRKDYEKSVKLEDCLQRTLFRKVSFARRVINRSRIFLFRVKQFLRIGRVY